MIRGRRRERERVNSISRSPLLLLLLLSLHFTSLFPAAHSFLPSSLNALSSSTDFGGGGTAQRAHSDVSVRIRFVGDASPMTTTTTTSGQTNLLAFLPCWFFLPPPLPLRHWSQSALPRKLEIAAPLFLRRPLPPRKEALRQELKTSRSRKLASACDVKV